MMKLGLASSVEELQIISRFESVREILLSDRYAVHRDKPLAYWALPTDRRLPLAFLNRTLEDLLHTPFAELSETPGIGQKKMCSFVQLLARAANTDPSELPVDSVCFREKAREPAAREAAPRNGFDPANVSEVVWSQWRASVVKHGLEGEVVGRFVSSLRNMTRVIWNAPLGNYTHRTLAEIREMKTHGEKRVRAILEAFHSVHTLVAQMGDLDHLVVRIVPRLIDRAETWIGGALQTPGVPSPTEIFDRLIHPLLEQVRIDASRQIASLAESRLATDGSATSVRQAARAMGLTRARVYQLLNEINDIMMVRWPTGRHLMYEFREKLRAEAAKMDDPPDFDQFEAAVELFYPGSRRGAAGPLERAPVGEPEDKEPGPVREKVLVR